MKYQDESDSFMKSVAGNSRPGGIEVEPLKTDEDVKLYSREEMEGMERASLVSHAWRIQKAYGEVERESKFLAWEFNEYHDNVALSSLATRVAHKLNAADLDAIATVATTDIPQHFGCGFATMFLFDTDAQHFTMYRCFPKDGCGEVEAGAKDSFLLRLLSSHPQPFIAEYCDEGGVIEMDSGGHIRVDVPEFWFKVLGNQSLIFPLRVKQRDGEHQHLLLGGLLLGDAQRELKVKDAEEAVLFSDLLSSSLYNARLVEQLNELTIIEPLTKIYNRRHLFNQLDAAMIQAQRHGHPLSIAMVDIDHFKQFNDIYGHMCGDEVLREVAGILKSGIRTGIDIPTRYGGEEFILVLPFTGLDAAMEVADRLRKAIKDHTVRYEGKELSVTCSFGVAEFIKGENAEKFIERADASLYQAKSNGRNQVCASTTVCT